MSARFLPILLMLAACGGSDDPYDALARKIERKDPKVQEEARTQLVHLGGDRAVEVFNRFARNDSQERIFLTLSGLSSLTEDSPKALESMIRFLDHPSVPVRREAARLLAFDGSPGLVAPLLRACNDVDVEVRRTCLGSLEWRDAAEALPLFRAALRDADAKLREIGERAVFKQEWRERSREIRYHPPASTPYPKGSKEEREYLDGHRSGWNSSITSITPEEIESGKLAGSLATCCEAPESVTKGYYAGQREVGGFLGGLSWRVAADPELKSQFAQYRLETIAHPK